ncbi:MAG: GNAT family N-acetyltransferase [Flavobacterium sp.]
MKNENISIREFEVNDSKKIVDLFRLNVPKFFAKEEEKDLIQYLENEIELYYVLLYDGKIVGSGGINFENEMKTGIISWDIIHFDFQGKKLGSQLLKHRIEKLKTIESIQEIVVRTSQFTYLFYDKQGFEISEIIKDYWAKGFDLYSMKYKNL